MKAASFDPSKLLTLYFRIARAGSKTFIFRNGDGSAYDLSNIEFQLNIKRYKDGDDVITLAEGAGLIIGGAGSNELTVAVDEDLTALDPAIYYWQLQNLTAVKTWLNGDAQFHNGKFDAPDAAEEITITENGEDVVITISDGTGGTGNITDIDGGTP